MTNKPQNKRRWRISRRKFLIGKDTNEKSV